MRQMLLLLTFCFPSLAWANPLIVSNSCSGNNCFATIKLALDSLGNSNTVEIQVYDNTYTDQLTIDNNQNVTITGMEDSVVVSAVMNDLIEAKNNAVVTINNITVAAGGTC
ncbi:MAG: hypothetical protein HN348_04860, partial [Proteobacteria bacterium]|nr:hypothetical protein [Pseudomonadota bacterium]